MKTICCVFKITWHRYYYKMICTKTLVCNRILYSLDHTRRSVVVQRCATLNLKWFFLSLGVFIHILTVSCQTENTAWAFFYSQPIVWKEILLAAIGEQFETCMAEGKFLQVCLPCLLPTSWSSGQYISHDWEVSCPSPTLCTVVSMPHTHTNTCIA